MTSPDQDPSMDPNAEPAQLTPEQRIEQLEQDNAQLQDYNNDLRNRNTDIAEEMHNIRTEMAEMRSAMEAQGGRLRRSELFNKVVGGFALAAAVVATVSFFDKKSNDRVITQTVAEQTDTSSSDRQRAQLSPQTGTTEAEGAKAAGIAVYEAATADDEDEPQSTNEWVQSLIDRHSDDDTDEEQATAASSERDFDPNTSIDNFVKKYDAESGRAAANEMFNNVGKFNGLQNSNDKNRQVHLKSFDKNISTQDAIESHFAGVINASEYSATILNGLEGKPGSAPRSDSHAERVKEIGRVYKDKDTDYNGSFRWQDSGINHYTDKVTGKVSGKVQNLDGIRMLQIIPGDSKYKTIYIKLGGGTTGLEDLCANLVQQVPKVVQKGPDGKIQLVPQGGGVGGPGGGGGFQTEIVPGGGSGGGGSSETTTTGGGEGGSQETTGGGDTPCPPGTETHEGRCVHPAASGPPPEVSQPPRPAASTPGYTPGNAEAVAGTQGGDPTNLDPTPHGTEVPNSSAGGGAPGGGAESVVSAPPADAPANPAHQPGTASPGSSAGTSNGAGSGEAQTGATGETTAAGSAPADN